MNKKIIIITLLIIMTLSPIINASTLNYDTIKDNILYRQYTVEEQENNNFYESLEDTVTIRDNTYKKTGYNVTGGKEIKTIDIQDTKEIISKTNNLIDILNALPSEIKYNKDNYIGINKLDIKNIQVKEIYNGYYEEFIEETEHYFDLDKNDMSYIPKTITKDNHTLYLIDVNWYTQTTKQTGNNTITDLYRGVALYRGVKRINNPLTYRVIANYKGTATKEIYNYYHYIIKYEKVNNEDNNSPLFPILATSTTGISVIIIIVWFANNKKIKLYGLEYGKYKYLGKYSIKNNTLDISKSSNVNTNKYKFVLDKKSYNCYKNKTINIVKNELKKDYNINNNIFEIKL